MGMMVQRTPTRTLIQPVVLAQIIFGQLMPVIVAVLYYSRLGRGSP